jgi:hypothetical protein
VLIFSNKEKHDGIGPDTGGVLSASNYAWPAPENKNPCPRFLFPEAGT